jgi:hypothetical protein
MARMLIGCVCLDAVATVGRRCEQCAPVEARAAARKGSRPQELVDPAALLEMAESDPEAALAALEALQ